MWVVWDDEAQGPTAMLRELPENVAALPPARIRALGYRELRTVKPEDVIPRYERQLIGGSKFEVQPDGSILQTYPNADFSVEAVRTALKAMARVDAALALGSTDWYIIRKAELGTLPPPEILTLRDAIRNHVDWISAKADMLEPRELVDFQYVYPSDPAQVMIDGVPTVIVPTPPGEPEPQPLEPALPLEPFPDVPALPEINMPVPPPTTDGLVHVQAAQDDWERVVALAATTSTKLVVIPGIPIVEDDPQQERELEGPSGVVYVDKNEMRSDAK